MRRWRSFQAEPDLDVDLPRITDRRRLMVGERAIDRGIRDAVRILSENGVETTESCEGGRGHPFPQPTVRFRGGKAEGFRALGVALQHGLRVDELRRYWSIEDGEPVGPYWEMTFVSKLHHR